MNLLRKLMAAGLFQSSPSPRKCQFLLHSVSTLHQSSMYSTSYTCTSTSRLTKQQKQSQDFENSKPNQSDQPLLSAPSSSEVVRKRTPSPAPVRQKEREVELVTSNWPRPGEIPRQAKKANSVNLIGRVQVPVQFHSSSDGKYWSVTIIAQDQDNAARSATSSFEPPPFWIAVIFEGDLAHIAACHLKEKDLVYIDGRLTADLPPFTINHGHANAQVLAHGVSFVLDYSQHNKSIAQKEVERTTIYSASKTKGRDSTSSTWRVLLKDPKQWWDYRENKLNGLVKLKHPDFKHKDGGLALWLCSAPDWVLSGIQGLNFDIPNHIRKPVKEDCKGSDSWKNLVENPEKWWDNRSKKVNEKWPDFKHKDTGEGLWLSNSPAWVVSKLPPLKGKPNVTFGHHPELNWSKSSNPRSA